MLESFFESRSSLLCGLIAVVVLFLTLINFCSKKTVGDLAKKHVLITGCDSGFGRQTAIRLDEMGVNVFATCLTKEGEQSLKSVTSDRLITLHLDVTDSQQIKNVFEQVKEILSRSGQGLWGLVNNAGIPLIAPIEWIPLDRMKRVADVNLWGMIDVTKTFLPLVKKSRGRVLNLSSMLGRLALPHLSAYCITKYGVEAFSDALRREMSPWGVLVSMIEPGLFKSGFTAVDSAVRSIQDMWNGLSPELKEEYGECYVNRVIKGTMKASESASPDSFKVVDAVIDALTSVQPNTRYAVGLQAKMSNFFSLLPAAITDRLIRMQMKSSRDGTRQQRNDE